MQLTDVGTNALTVSIIGTGAVTGVGRAGRLDVDVSGTGRLDLAQLQVEDAKLDVSGTGHIEVAVNRALEALASGTGAIVYSGDPSVRSKVTGTGDLRHK